MQQTMTKRLLILMFTAIVMVTAAITTITDKAVSITTNTILSETPTARDTTQPISPRTLRGKPGIPTAKYVDHVGITVPDINQALKFFVDVLGADVLWIESEGTGTQTPLDMHGIFNVDPRSSITLSMLRFGPNINLELLQYKAPDQNLRIPKNSDVDVPHLAFFVDNIDTATAYLQSKGVQMFKGPNKTAHGPKMGQVIRYFLTPWGSSMELVYRPESLPYEQQTPARLNKPASSWR
ncbi:MAG: VOC family protein [Rhizonema sp. PD37]|nr:VOC family protein [Rhizonema sp. PD37]